MGGWKERKMDVVGRRYGKGLSNEEEVRGKKVLSGEEEKVKMVFWTENCEGIRQMLWEERKVVHEKRGRLYMRMKNKLRRYKQVTK
jgi:hypothetical protein